MLNVRRSFFLAVLLGLLSPRLAAWGQSRTIRGSRWLAITRLNGPVEIIPFGAARRPARLGERLNSVGDILITGPEAAARLEVDLATGFISVSENSRLQIRTLSVTQSGGRITELLVLRGQARLQIRPLSNPDSRIEIYTPAGVSGVRGTEFGVSVGPTGQTGVATLEGSVVSSAQGQSVTVNAQQQSVIRPDEPPSPPEPLRNDPSLSIEVLRPTGRLDGQSSRLVQVIGYTDSVNLLSLNGEQQPLERNGRFEATVSSSTSSSTNGRIALLVTTPLGTTQQYELVIP